MGSESHTLHMLFFPFMAAGHMLPMVDMAKLFAVRGVKATILTTPANAPKILPTIDRANENFILLHPIQLHLIPFPTAEAGLPDGCENTSAIPSRDLGPNFFNAVAMLRRPFDRVLRDLLPDCVVTDMFLPWTYNVAAEHGIPRLVFHGMNLFALCAQESVDQYNGLLTNSDSFVLPGLPHRIEMLKSQIPELSHCGQPPFMEEILNQRKESEAKSYGTLVNSFYELEPDYAEHYRKVLGRKAWHVGPVALCNEDITEKSARGSGVAKDSDACLKWLDGQRPSSVVYVCFGTVGYLSADEVRDIAWGLEASGHPFVWALRKGSGEEWMPEGFEERVEGRGLIIRGWAPQILILNHQAVGGFLTHCGWNSSLEGISAGLPLITCPMFAEQFYNERLIVDVLKIGVSLGVKEFAMSPEGRKMVEAVVVKEAVEKLMGGGEEEEERRRRAKGFGEMARAAVEKGGSSSVGSGNLIEELMNRKIASESQSMAQIAVKVQQSLALRNGNIVCN